LYQEEIIRGMHPPAFLLQMGSAVADFMLRQDAGGFKGAWLEGVEGMGLVRDKSLAQTHTQIK